MTNMYRSIYDRRWADSMIILVVLCFISLGCLGPGSAESKCGGTVKNDGEIYRGSADDEKQAGLNACNKYCIDEDSEFDGMYRVWLDSAAGKRAAEKLKREPTREDSLMESDRLLDYVTKNCANRCVNEANNGKHTLDVSCRKS